MTRPLWKKCSGPKDSDKPINDNSPGGPSIRRGIIIDSFRKEPSRMEHTGRAAYCVYCAGFTVSAPPSVAAVATSSLHSSTASAVA